MHFNRRAALELVASVQRRSNKAVYCYDAAAPIGDAALDMLPSHAADNQFRGGILKLYLCHRVRTDSSVNPSSHQHGARSADGNRKPQQSRILASAPQSCPL